MGAVETTQTQFVLFQLHPPAKISPVQKFQNLNLKKSQDDVGTGKNGSKSQLIENSVFTISLRDRQQNLYCLKANVQHIATVIVFRCDVQRK